MEALFFLIPLALIFCAIAIKAFFWAVDHRQFDNLDSAAHSILFDEEISSDGAANLQNTGGENSLDKKLWSQNRDGA